MIRCPSTDKYGHRRCARSLTSLRACVRSRLDKYIATFPACVRTGNATCRLDAANWAPDPRRSTSPRGPRPEPAAKSQDVAIQREIERYAVRIVNPAPERNEDELRLSASTGTSN